jgi:adenylate kinase
MFSVLCCMNIIILGPQGSGKGTQALFLSEKLDAIHIDLGRTLRKLAKEETPLGKKLYEIVHVKKELVSDDVIKKVLTEEFKKIPVEKGIILDGAPRRIEQIGDVKQAFSISGREIDRIIFINLPQAESIDRVSRRYSCPKCHKHFALGENLENASDLCPDCNSPVEQRKDDTKEGILKRLSIFKDQTIPVIEYFRKEGVLIEVDGTKSKTEILDEILEKLKK